MERTFLLREINSLNHVEGIKDFEGNPTRPASGKAGNAKLELSNGKFIIGPNGATRLYYVTTGAFGNNLSAKFPVKVTNTNSLAIGKAGLNTGPPPL